MYLITSILAVSKTAIVLTETLNCLIICQANNYMPKVSHTTLKETLAERCFSII